MSYTPPAIDDPIVLEAAYTPPAITEPIVLCAVADEAVGILYAPLPVPEPPLVFSAAIEHVIEAEIFATPAFPSLSLTFTASEIPPRVGETLWAKMPLLRPTSPSIDVAGVFVHTLSVDVDLAAIVPPLTFRARESMHLIEIAIDLPAPDLQLIYSAIGDRVHVPRLASDLPLPDLPFVYSGAGDRIHVPRIVVALPALPPTLSAIVDAVQLLDLPDAAGPGVPIRASQSQSTTSSLGVAQQDMRPTQCAMLAWAKTADPIVVPTRLRDTQALPLRRTVETPHTHGTHITADSGIPHTGAFHTRRPTTWRHQHGIRFRAGVQSLYADTIRTRTKRALTHHHGVDRTNGLNVDSQHAVAAVSRMHVRWQQGIIPAPGRWWPTYETPPLTIVIHCTPYTPRPLTCPVVLGPTIVIQPPCPEIDPDPPGIFIPILEAYVVINTFTLVRASDETPIEAASFSASLDRDSWCWSFTARIPASALSLIAPVEPGSPRELIGTLNGTPLRLLAESIRRDRRHGSAWLTVSGRGRAAWLSEPYAPIEDRYNAESRTAQQLLVDALEVNGVPIGWSIDWQLEDWTVPAGAWSHNGTYIDAAVRIAEGGGGYIQAHDTTDTLIVLPHYPVAPWLWDEEDPDITLPEDVCEIEGIEWMDKAPYNAVFVVGGEDGRRDRIKRTGTAADRPAPTIVDPLATSTTMTRQRGLATLADTGRQAHISLRMPVLPETGIIRPGKLIDYTENGTTRRGLSRAVSVEHTHPELWQTVRIETHEQQPV